MSIISLEQKTFAILITEPFLPTVKSSPTYPRWRVGNLAANLGPTQHCVMTAVKMAEGHMRCELNVCFGSRCIRRKNIRRNVASNGSTLNSVSRNSSFTPTVLKSIISFQQKILPIPDTKSLLPTVKSSLTYPRWRVGNLSASLGPTQHGELNLPPVDFPP
ncbi:hypothetical protein CDAR_498451 [Caerostris darwini]|uniref:Uncharacterized protein n=1 Tax=Caerostris darwini TaxID=1538125 RepID=A0AAV4P5U3_9ARAC|nr:hypothetical protein CDAR_498451 [Caerostris darwini]